MAPQLLACVVSPSFRCVTVGVGDSCIKSISVIFFDETIKCRLNQNSRLQPDKAKGGVNGSRIKVKNAGRYGFSFDRGRRLDYIAGVGKIGYAVFLPAYKKRECVGGLCPVQHVQPLPLCPCRAKPITCFQKYPIFRCHAILDHAYDQSAEKWLWLTPSLVRMCPHLRRAHPGSVGAILSNPFFKLKKQPHVRLLVTDCTRLARH